VGGSCIELEAADGDRLVLDLGLPLSAGPAEEVALPTIDGLDGGDPTLRGVLVSHGHPDHYGLIGSISAGVPLYIGQAAARILREASFFTPLGLDREPTGVLIDRRPFTIGAFTVTPYLVDHSAFDAYALQVDADGRRLFYTADLRAHGRKAGLMERLFREPPGSVDALLLEGTTIGRDAASHPLSETGVEQRCAELFRATPGMALACYSPQNIDRLVSVYRAALRSDRDLVLDLYGAAVAAATGKETIPQQSWDRVRVYVPQAQRVKVKSSGQFWRVNDLGASRIYLDEIAKNPAHWVFSFRAPMGPELQRADCLDGARALWMMWPGYLDGESGHKTRDAFSRLGIDPEVVHASGHATVADLRRLAVAINAGSVVPIHTDAPQRYSKLFDRVTTHPNNEWWEI
jgi:ribonuclease J